MSKEKQQQQTKTEESTGKRFQTSIDEMFGLIPEPSEEPEEDKESDA